MKRKKHSLELLEKEKLITDICVFINKHYQNISFVYLFGSFNNFGHFSDIDLAIFTKTQVKKPLEFEIALEAELERICNYPIDVRIINKAPLSFCYSVIRNGKLILDREQNLRADFEGNILKQYFDFSTFRCRYLEEVKNAPI
jgi:predicted nucleotidyltransferase